MYLIVFIFVKGFSLRMARYDSAYQFGPDSNSYYGPGADSSSMIPDDDDFGHGYAHDKKPRILLMGLHRSGKSSIQKVVFHKMNPSDTLFLESTNQIVKDDINSNR